MPSSDRTAQLGIWRDIVASLHENTKPADDRLDSIRQCFNELDSEGFIWSKESIFGIFTELGLSKISHGRLSPLNNSQGHEVSSVKVKDITQIEKSKHKSRPVGLADLPIEVFYKILEQLDFIAVDEVWKIYKEKLERRVMITGPVYGNYMTYLHRNSPILNSTQSFSLTSRQIYSLCRPWLWRKLEFPSSLPAPIDLWTEDILVRQGAHVQTLKVMLSKNCSKPPGQFAKEEPFYDNLSPLYYVDRLELYQSKDQQKPGDGSFGFNLSQLKSLSKLTLWQIEDIDVNWCLYNWPRTITKLMILECGDLSLSSAHQIIHHIAPHLTKLDLKFSYKLDGDSWEIDPSWDTEKKFSLPFLTELSLSTRNAHLLESFQDCKYLRRLEWTYRTSKHCRSLNMMLFNNTWPQLKILYATHHWRLRLPALDPRLQEIEDQLTVLEKHFEQANMEGFIRRPNFFGQ
ncbi:uncharacterized protein MELLADRAFT_116215 [Melampsora larici-populina 98AG31]|uniref:F-box domain-containing protein n=1 Tax=Melampsora larici-populina (strain 98AG31 / pathotype 3-4-7) TaxID=747676 RepID=F4RIZ0_MELLP|nr:uncharacterized protein MELLADRAFT_116215 [Melampsora larici-populina 98AG31]EGG07747.1 hypothetical protein MELLADRAFT_116215 [Melampsora larici-populina 98AG31]